MSRHNVLFMVTPRIRSAIMLLVLPSRVALANNGGMARTVVILTANNIINGA